MTATEQQMVTIGGLTMPDLRPHFKHLHWRPMPHSFGVDVASDWADKPADDRVFGLYKNCGLWTLEEAAILYNCAEQTGGHWLDIGAHTGWTAAHIASAGALTVQAIDPMIRVDSFAARGIENLRQYLGVVNLTLDRSEEYFAWRELKGNRLNKFDGVVIDGDHDRPWPLNDAQNALKHLAPSGVIIFHDAWGAPVYEAAEWLMNQGMKARFYDTVHGVIVCWRGEFGPPNYTPLPEVPWPRLRLESTFPFHRCQ